MAYAKKTMLEDGIEALFDLVNWSWRFGIALVFGCFAGFVYSMPGAFRNLEMKEADILGNMFPKVYPIVHPLLCFSLPIMWLMLAAVFAWASHRSWMKKNSDPSHWH